MKQLRILFLLTALLSATISPAQAAVNKTECAKSSAGLGLALAGLASIPATGGISGVVGIGIYLANLFVGIPLAASGMKACKK